MRDTAMRIHEKMNQAGIAVSEKMAEQLDLYRILLLRQNEVMNLTAITEFEDILYKHFVDSCAGIPVLEGELHGGQALKVIDIGTGAGFPGIPLKIVMPDLSLTLLDSLNKRVRFLQETGEELGLLDVQYIHSRAEDAALAKKGKKNSENRSLREQYDAAVSRAVSALPVLLEYCLPYVKVGGIFIAYKSEAAGQEILDAAQALKTLGGEVEKVVPYELPYSYGNRNLVVVRKVKATPAAYPRKAGMPLKKPL